MKFANSERDRLLAYENAEPPKPEESEGALRTRLYFGDPEAIGDRLKLTLSLARQKEDLDTDDAI